MLKCDCRNLEQRSRKNRIAQSPARRWKRDNLILMPGV